MHSVQQKRCNYTDREEINTFPFFKNGVMVLVAQTKAKNKIIILDSCFSGTITNHTNMTNYLLLQNGTTLLATCSESEYHPI